MLAAAAVMTTAGAASAQNATLWGAAGLGVPMGQSSPSVQGAESLILDLRVGIDFGSVFQLAASGWLLFPGIDSPQGNVGNFAYDLMAEGRLFLIQVASLRPYVGLGVGYSGSSFQIQTCDYFCNDKVIPGPSGLVLSPLAGLRIDFPRSRRTVSLYVEGGYQATFSSPAVLDRAFVQVGPGISL